MDVGVCRKGWCVPHAVLEMYWNASGEMVTVRFWREDRSMSHAVLVAVIDKQSADPGVRDR